MLYCTSILSILTDLLIPSMWKLITVFCSRWIVGRNKCRHWQIFCLSWNIKQTEAKVSNAEQQMSSVVNCTVWPTGWLPYCAWAETGDSRTVGKLATVGQTQRGERTSILCWRRRQRPQPWDWLTRWLCKRRECWVCSGESFAAPSAASAGNAHSERAISLGPDWHRWRRGRTWRWKRTRCHI